MRIVYVDPKYSIEEPQEIFSSIGAARIAMSNLLRKGLATFGQILDADGLVLVNCALPEELYALDSEAPADVAVLASDSETPAEAAA